MSTAPTSSTTVARRGRPSQEVTRRPNNNNPPTTSLVRTSPSSAPTVSGPATGGRFNPAHLPALRDSALRPPSSSSQPSANLSTDLARFLNQHGQYRDAPSPIDPDIFVAPTDAQSALTVIGARATVERSLQQLPVERSLQQLPQRRLLLGGAGFADDQYWHEGGTVSFPVPGRSASVPPSTSRGGSQGAKTSWPSSRDSFHSAESGLHPLLPLTSAYKGKGKEVMTRPRSSSGTVASGSVAIRPTGTIDRTDPRNQIDIRSLPKANEDHRLTYRGSLSISSESSAGPIGRVSSQASSASIRSSSAPPATASRSGTVHGRVQQPQGQLMNQRKPFPTPPVPQAVQPLQHFRGRGGSTAAATLRRGPPTASSVDRTFAPSHQTSGGAKLHKKRR